MNDALAEFREKQRQKYLERQRKDEANKTVTAPAPATTLSPSSASTFPPTIGTVKASSAQVSPNPLRTPAAPIIPTAVTHTAIEQPTLQPSLSRDEELARRLQEEEDARHARELSAQVNNDNGAPMTSSGDDVRPPDTQFTERLLDTPAIPISTAYTRSLFSPDVVRPVQAAAPVPPTIPQRSDYHAFGIGPSTRTIQMPPLTHVNPLAPNYAPGDAPTLRNDQSPPRHFQFPTTVHPPLITPHRPTFVTHRQNPVFAAAAARSPGSSWISTPSPIPSDPEEDARERQLREDAALARRLQEEDQRAFG